jgi:cytosine/adenosine deaminase-related metal-dependent hydrolase
VTEAPTSRGLSLINASFRGGDVGSLRVLGSRIAALNERPHRDDLVIDLEGDRVLPGLINAHDHLQLNSLPCLGSDKRYAHVRQWIADINRRRHSDAGFETQVKVARRTRLLVGGIKNLLSGVTTVAHHDPLYADLLEPNYPVEVVAHYGWSHSLYIDGPEAVQESYRGTPNTLPWIIHAAEGVDEEAALEFDRLDVLGCIGANTLLVHGVALDAPRLRRLEAASAGLLWCPASNLRLFGRTAEAHHLLGQGRIALGTDSRLSGSRDLLDELRLASEVARLDEHSLEALVTTNSARLLRLPERGSLQIGYRADILVLPRGVALSQATRASVRLVIQGGAVRYADGVYAGVLRPATRCVDIEVDGRAKLLDVRVARMLHESGAQERGLTITHSSLEAA